MFFWNCTLLTTNITHFVRGIAAQRVYTKSELQGDGTVESLTGRTYSEDLRLVRFAYIRSAK